MPDIEMLQERVVNGLDEDKRVAFERQLEKGNLEQALSRLRRITALLTDEETVDGLRASDASSLDAAVCKVITQELDLADADLEPVQHLAAWAAGADYHLPVELFTVNYDLLLETALESCNVPYFDGFVGSIEAQFQTELVEATPAKEDRWIPSFFVRLWKIHGSVNWKWCGNGQVVRIGVPVSGESTAAIYPSDTKYEESRRVPFVVLQDRFRRALNQPETLVLITGYSFSDDHLNELIFDAALRRKRSEYIAFCFGDIPAELAERALITPNLQALSPDEAIIGGHRDQWVDPDEPIKNLWQDGQFCQGDFRQLALYLARSVGRVEDESIIAAVVKGLAEIANSETND